MTTETPIEVAYEVAVPTNEDFTGSKRRNQGADFGGTLLGATASQLRIPHFSTSNPNLGSKAEARVSDHLDTDVQCTYIYIYV